MTTKTPQPTIYHRRNDGTWRSYDIGIELTGFDISDADVANATTLTEWIADFMRDNPGEWYACHGDVESAVVTINECAANAS